MGVITSSPYCAPCERYEHWIELIIRDEHNQPFPNIRGTLTDGSGKVFNIVVGHAPIFLSEIAPGRVQLKLDNKTWLTETQQRLPYSPIDGNNKTQTQQWHEANAKGYQDSDREFHVVSLGDFVELQEGQTLPKRHMAGVIGKLDLVSDMSAVVQVQGFRAVALRFGVFFDGTANNTYSSKWGKQQFDRVQQQWVSRYNQHKNEGTAVPDHLLSVEKVTGQEVASSAANELTNVQKLFDLYQSDVFSEDGSTFIHKEYITGIGTSNSTAIAKAEESVLAGQALGLGDWGVVGKTTTAIENVCNSLPSILTSLDSSGKPVDAITKIEFDVFGFSRGSAAARNFVNAVLDGEEGEFVQAFIPVCQREQIALSGGFDWSSNDNCQIKFAGLFDTVASIINIPTLDVTAHNDDNSPVRLYLDPKRVERAVHFVANRKTEYRANFGVNLLNTDGGSKFTEIRLLGAHSDIGGGYYSRMAFGGDNQFWLPRYENKLVATSKVQCGRVFVNIEADKQKVAGYLAEHKQVEIRQGWREQNYVKKFEHKDFGKHSAVVGRLVYINTPQGDLSRLYLRAMYGLAKHAKVPVTDEIEKGKTVWNASSGDFNLYYAVPEKLFKSNMEAFPFGQVCEDVLQETKQGKLTTLLKYTDESARQLFVNLSLIHHSSDTTLAAVVKPNKPDDSEEQWEQREREAQEVNRHEHAYTRMEYEVTKDH
ncbi:phospholipase effector Tle1 domain-containing protein [Vibrio jasicida]|uniref:phospholipase effector Tle1 domain-containing protein n=1 Tax=Vibrio jasicida TaxID=766224 RepID=UPI0005F09EC7|nr:DUF2235 domain-containing protein [Vibrio jasicida]